MNLSMIQLTLFNDGIAMRGHGVLGSSEGDRQIDQNQRLACFVCRSTEHFQRACPNQYCQSCGKKGNDRRDCYSKRKVFSVGHGFGSSQYNESGVMDFLQLNGIQTTVMLDSGAQPSIIDTVSLEKLGVDCQGRPGRVHGVHATPITTRGVVDLRVEFGVYPMKHRFIVLESREQTIILGRDFLKVSRRNLIGKIIVSVWVSIGCQQKPHFGVAACNREQDLFGVYYKSLNVSLPQRQ